MIPLKKHPKKQLEKYSAIFMQIGLILVLFIVHVVIEKETQIDKVAVIFEKSDSKNTSIPYYEIFEKEKVKKKKPQKEIKPLPEIDLIEKAKEEEVETIIPDDISEEKEPIFDIDKIETLEETPEPDDDSHIYDARMFTPTFFGCENLSIEENRTCFENKLRKFVQKRFNTEQGLDPGTYRIFSEFVIDKKGEIDNIRIKAPSKRLEKEMRRIIQKLPKFIPGKQAGKPVNVKYMLPLAFKVD